MAGSAMNRLVTTHRSEFEPIGAYGEQVWRNADQIRDTLRRRLSDEHASLFALPRQREDGDAMDWFADVQGSPRRWDGLPREEQERHARRVEAMVADIERTVSELRGSGARGAGIISDSLEGACHVASTRHIYIVDDRPVVTAWSLKDPVERSAPSVLPRLSDHVGKSPPEPEPPSVAAEALTPAPAPDRAPLALLWWGIGAALLLALILLILFFLDAWPFGPRPRTAVQFPEKIEQSHGPTAGKEPGQAVVPANGEELSIPEEASATESLEFLEGWWTSTSELFNVNTGAPVVIEYKFDADGEGRSWIIEPSQKCEAPARAEFRNGRLFILQLREPACPDGSFYSRSETECTAGEGGRAACVAKQERVEQVEVRMTRK